MLRMRGAWNAGWENGAKPRSISYRDFEALAGSIGCLERASTGKEEG